MKYGARHLKRAIDRTLVHPLSNLIATDQIRGGDLIRVDYDTAQSRMTFFKEAEDMPAYAMVQMVDVSLSPPMTMSAGAVTDQPRAINAKRSR
jgi:ATP-dependent Clp protease ATP-binding subunit ClpB